MTAYNWYFDTNASVATTVKLSGVKQEKNPKKEDQPNEQRPSSKAPLRGKKASPIPTLRRNTLNERQANKRDTSKNVREAASNGVMDEGSGKVQNASTHRLRTPRESDRTCQGDFIQRGDG